jgi:hypothetical protein
MQDKNYEQKISFLDWGIVISAILLLLTVYLPQVIWKEEIRFRKEARHRMTAIANAEEFYLEMIGSYTTDGPHLFALVEAAMDSLIADTLFTGEKIIHLNGNAYLVDMDREIASRIDTTFSNPTELYYSYYDTVYTIGMKNFESGGIDTIFVNDKDLSKYQSDEFFQEIYNEDIVNRTELRTDFLREKYHLDNSMLYCPLTNNPYIFELDTTNEEPVFTITSPLHILEEPYTEARFGVFTFDAGDHGYIRGTQKSWAE